MTSIYRLATELDTTVQSLEAIIESDTSGTDYWAGGPSALTPEGVETIRAQWEATADQRIDEAEEYEHRRKIADDHTNWKD